MGGRGKGEGIAFAFRIHLRIRPHLVLGGFDWLVVRANGPKVLVRERIFGLRRVGAEKYLFV